MNWNYCFTALISLGLLCFPNNMIGCGPDEDPYDYYTSFFSQKLSGDRSFRPFYYTGYRFLHDETEPVSTKEITSEEWVGYTNNKTVKKDVQRFVLTYSYKQLRAIYNHIEKKAALTVPDSVKQNSFTKWLIDHKDLEAVSYLMYAKQTEPYVTGDEDQWSNITRNEEQMKALMKKGIQLWTAAKNDFIKLRYGYQVTRLAHYSEQYKECLSCYALYIQPNNTVSVLKDLAMSLKAGALQHLGKQEEAAYLFSQLFATNKLKRRSNYISFIFSTRDEETGKTDMNHILRFCKTDQEKANVISSFIISSTKNNLPELQQIYQLDPSSAMLGLLLIREINKLEEKYLHPSLQKLKGKKIMYSWSMAGGDYDNPNYDSIYNEGEKQTKEMIGFCHNIAQNTTISNRGLYEVAGAYAAFMIKDFRRAKELLQSSAQLNLSPDVKDQWMMTNLLVTINEQQTIDASFEEQLLPSIQWLEKKAMADDEWNKFYRNLFSEILATRYINQKEISKAALATGCAEQRMKTRNQEDNYYSYFNENAIEFLRSKMNSKEVESLYTLMQSATKTKWESYLVNRNSFSTEDVSDVAGTACLREHDWINAERWFKLISPKYYKNELYTTYLSANPFADLLYDTHAPTKQDTVKYSKLRFAQKMKQLQLQVQSGTNEQKAKAYYQLANGLYQSSYWGNSWMLQEYNWSGNDGLSNLHTKGSWQREYFGVFKAEDYYLKAKELTANVSFKARCTWMAAKCSQKQSAVPRYEQFNDYDLYDKAMEQHAKNIRKNNYYSSFVKEYSNTGFYKEVFNSCVYLKDYVKGK